MTLADNLRRILQGYSGQGDDALRQELADPHTELGRTLRAVRIVAAAPLDLRRLGDVDEILAFEAARGDSADWHIDLNDPAPDLRRLADLAAHRIRDERRIDAIDVLVHVVRLALVHLGEGHRDTPTYINALARLYYQTTDYQTAARGFARAIELRTAVMGPNHTDTAISLTGLARVREAQGHYKEAVELHRRALGIFEATLGAGHPDTGVNLNDLGCVLHTVGELAEAKGLLERALAISREFDGADSPNAAIILSNLAGVLQSQGALEEASVMYYDALAIVGDSPEADRATYRWALSNYGSALELLGPYQGGRDKLRAALGMGFGDSPDERLGEATLRNNLGMALLATAELAEARTEFQSAVDLLRPMVADEHPLIQAIRLNLARCATGDLVPSSAQVAAQLADFQAALGTTHPPVAVLGTTGIWIVPCDGLSFPVMLALAA